MVIALRPRGGTLDGKKLEDFIKIYWQTLCPIPKKDNPAWSNNGGKDDSFNKLVKEKLYMLSFSRNPQAAVTRTIHVPSDNEGLFIPVMSVIVSKCETTDDLIPVANKDQASILASPGVELVLDGNSAPHGGYVFAPASIGTFPVKFPAQTDAIFNIPNSNSCNAVAAGRYVWTNPLSPGAHTVHFKGKISCTPPNCIDTNYSEDITYNITVP
jgi:hypothetical protein